METMRPPTYTVFFARDDQLEFRTFAWSLADGKAIEIDRVILWEDEALPKDILATLPHTQGADLIDTIEKLGALLYEPAAKDLLAYIEPGNEAEVRRAAAKALRYIGTAGVSGDLAAYFDDPDLTVRREVAGAVAIAMEPALAPRAARHARDPQQDDRVRVALIGAVQLHGDDQLIHDTGLALLHSNASEQVRQRAAYAFGTVGHQADLQTVAKLFEVESDQHVMMHLAWVMQQLTGKPDAALDDEFEHEGQRLAGSKAGERGAFTTIWLSE